MVSAGVPQAVADSSASVGCILRGVADLWNYGSGSVGFSEYFKMRVTQLAMTKVAVEEADVQAVFDLLGNRKALAEAQDNLPIFKMEKEGATKFVLPIVGKGLWGDIWGYVALQQTEDNVAIKGIVMDHAGETPGLGAEIATEKVQKAFEGKMLYNAEGAFAVRMQKGGAQNDYQVDAITGGTKTCDGVNAMLAESIAKYESFLRATEAAAEADVVAEEAVAEAEGAEEPAEENVEPKTEEE
jgi:Na+-transporting NADH:ubiquinone oxidoreductase subunit C